MDTSYEEWVRDHILSLLKVELGKSPHSSDKLQVVKHVSDYFPRPEYARVFVDSLIWFSSSKLDVKHWDSEVDWTTNGN